MATNNSSNQEFTNNADGFALGGGTTKRTLTATGANITITGAGTNTYTFPGTTDTLLGRASADTITGTKTFSSTRLALAGSTSGTTTLNATAVAGTTTLTLPAVTDTVAVLAAAQTLSTKVMQLAASTTALSSMRVAQGVAPTTPVEGDLWSDTTQKTLFRYNTGLKKSLDGTFYSQNAFQVVVNTAAETSAIGTAKGVGTATIPANFFAPGKTVRVELSGTYQAPAVPGSVIVKIKLGTVVVAQVTVAATILAANSTVRELQGWADITCYSTGATGTVVCDGNLSFEIAGGTTVVPFSTAATIGTATSTVTVDTTAAAVVDVTETWSNAQAGQGTTIGNGKIKEIY